MKPDECPDRQQISAYTFGTLSDEQMNALSEHLASCARCRAIADSLEPQTDALIELVKRASSTEDYPETPECQQALTRAKTLIEESDSQDGRIDAQAGIGRSLPARIVGRLRRAWKPIVIGAAVAGAAVGAVLAMLSERDGTSRSEEEDLRKGNAVADGGRDTGLAGHAQAGALVTHPAEIAGVKWWTIEPKAPQAAEAAHPPKSHPRVFLVAWSPDGNTLAAATSDGIRLLAADPVGFLPAIRIDDTTAMAFSPDGRTLAVAVASGEVDLVDVDSGVRQERFDQGDAQKIGWIVWSQGGEATTADGGRRAAVTPAGTVQICHGSTGRLLATWVPLQGSHNLLVSPQGHYRGTPFVGRLLVYVLQTEDGRQRRLAEHEFAQEYGWRNDPEKVTLGTIQRPPQQ